ncbi:MAG: Na+/H+ antiporter subunit E [Bacteroidales bacterium]|nr:Na+/H+ antiporter subunit E [Bacteroidales bacterium]
MRYLVLFILCMIIWILLTFSLELNNIIVGAVVSVLTSVIFGRYFIKNTSKFFQPKRYFWFIIYLIIFLWECLKANFDVAYRVLHPAMPIRPGIVKVKLNLRSVTARMMLANSITMTPGTLSVDLKDDILYVHWIYVSTTDPEIYGLKVAGRFEKYIKRIFD